MEECDILIVGAGQAGIPLARQLADCGKTVALAERRHLGGSCVNFGCTPTKAVLAAARVARLARRGAEFGLDIPNVTLNLRAVLARARGLVETSREHLADDLAAHRVRRLHGHARFTGRANGGGFLLDVAGQGVRARQVVLDVGTRSRLPAIDGLDRIDFLHAGNWLGRGDLFDHGPTRLVIAGAGIIAMESAQFYRTAGADVCVVGNAPQVLPEEDADVAVALQRKLEADGIAFRLGASVTAVAPDGDGHYRVTLSTGDALPATHLFLATGRKPNTDDLGLDAIGLTPRPDGTIPVDDRLSTGVAGVWAVGDVRGGPMFTHASWDDHRVLESQLLGDGSRTTKNRIVPYAVFTDPELGRVGLTERQARERFGDAVRVATFAMRHNGRAVQESDAGGFIKLIAERDSDRLLGAAVLSAEGGELVGNYVTLLNAGATLRTIAEAIYIHPTRTEAVQSAVRELGITGDPACD